MSDRDLKDLEDKVDGLAVMVGRIEERLDGKNEPGEAAMCAVHEHRMNKMEARVEGVEAAQGKRHLLVLVLGAVGYGIGLAVKNIFFKATS